MSELLSELVAAVGVDVVGNIVVVIVVEDVVVRFVVGVVVVVGAVVVTVLVQKRDIVLSIKFLCEIQ